MPAHEGLMQGTQYDWRDSNVELIGSDLDHKLKHTSANSELAWHTSGIGSGPGIWIWRIEEFEVKAWPKEKYGQFYEGDSYIILNTIKISKDKNNEKLIHDIFFWLGAKTSQDEAGTAAYKTVELDEYLSGAATQHRELQAQPSEDFVALFPRITILKGGVRSGFTHVTEQAPKEVTTLLRVFKHLSARRSNSIMVVEVEPIYQSLDEDDVFILDKGDKIWVWQGKKCSPMEKAKAAQVVHDLTLAKHIDVEVLSQSEARSKIVVDLLGGGSQEHREMKAKRPIATSAGLEVRTKRLFRISDASGSIHVELVKEGKGISTSDLDGNDVFLLDAGKSIWVWEGRGASRRERAAWVKIAQQYVNGLDEGAAAGSTPIAKVTQGHENPAFLAAIEA